jgi:hypothetical protein
MLALESVQRPVSHLFAQYSLETLPAQVTDCYTAHLWDNFGGQENAGNATNSLP